MGFTSEDLEKVQVNPDTLSSLNLPPTLIKIVKQKDTSLYYGQKRLYTELDTDGFGRSQEGSLPV